MHLQLREAVKIIEHHCKYFVVVFIIIELQINIESIRQHSFLSEIANRMVGMCLVLFLVSMSESGFTRLEDFQDALGGVLLLQDSQFLILQSLNHG